MSDKEETMMEKAERNLPKAAHILMGAVPYYSQLVGLMEFATGQDQASLHRKLQERFEKLLTNFQDHKNSVEKALQEHGKKLDELDELQETLIFQRLAKETFETVAPEKQRALMNIAARQYDPTLGSLSTRQYWWDEISQLSQIELYSIQLIGTKKIFISGRGEHVYRSKVKSDKVGHNLTIDDVDEVICNMRERTAVIESIQELRRKKTFWIVDSYQGIRPINNQNFNVFFLDYNGLALLEAMSLPKPPDTP